MNEERSSARITDRDLARFARFVMRGHERKCATRPQLRGRLRAGCLAQGGALHYLDPSNGLKDIDLWLFYDTRGLGPVGAKAIVNLDLGQSKFGRNPNDLPKYVGRRIDVMARSLPDASAELTPAEAVLAWLARPQASPRMLREKPVVMLWPATDRGRVIWRPGSTEDPT